MCQHVHGLHNPVYQYFQMPNAIKLFLDSSLQLMFRMLHARVCYQNTVQSSGYYTILLPNLVAVWGWLFFSYSRQNKSNADAEETQPRAAAWVGTPQLSSCCLGGSALHGSCGELWPGLQCFLVIQPHSSCSCSWTWPLTHKWPFTPTPVPAHSPTLL